eukprot:1061519-Pelagomonas_calceolata.AAC.5
MSSTTLRFLLCASRGLKVTNSGTRNAASTPRFLKPRHIGFVPHNLHNLQARRPWAPTLAYRMSEGRLQGCAKMMLEGCTPSFSIVRSSPLDAQSKPVPSACTIEQTCAQQVCCADGGPQQAWFRTAPDRRVSSTTAQPETGTAATTMYATPTTSSRSRPGSGLHLTA